jgi:hypothetical protein
MGSPFGTIIRLTLARGLSTLAFPEQVIRDPGMASNNTSLYHENWIFWQANHDISDLGWSAKIASRGSKRDVFG